MPLTGCGERSYKGPETVEWSYYSEDAKKRILQLVDDKDCYGMQRELDLAYNNKKINPGWSSLVPFLADSIEISGCYD